MGLPWTETIVVLCEDIRQEIRNKLSFLGVYGRNLIVAEIPAKLETLAVAVLIVGPTIDLNTFTVTFTGPSGGQVMKGLENAELGMARTEDPTQGHHVALKFQAPVFVEEGSHLLTITFNGDENLTIKTRFQVKVGDVSGS